MLQRMMSANINAVAYQKSIVIAILMLLNGCVTFPVNENNFFNPDHPPDVSSQGSSWFAIPGSEYSVSGVYLHREKADTVILYLGGNNFHVDLLGGSVSESFPEGINLIMFDYPGFGRSRGKTSIDSLQAAAREVYDYALSQGWLKNKKVIFYGFSLGGFVASSLASQRPVDGVILEATAPSVKAWAKSYVPFLARPFVKIDIAESLKKINNVATLEQAGVPVLVLSGGQDQQAKPELARKMVEQLKAAGIDATLVHFPSAAHGGIPQEGTYKREIQSFLLKLESDR